MLLSKTNIVMGICQMLLLQLHFDIYLVLNENKNLIYLWGVICPHTLIGPTISLWWFWSLIGPTISLWWFWSLIGPTSSLWWFWSLKGGSIIYVILYLFDSLKYDIQIKITSSFPFVCFCSTLFDRTSRMGGVY